MTILKFKPGVRLFGLQPEMLWAVDRCVDVWPDDFDVTVTSARGDKHSRQSRHNTGHAVDLRTRDLNDEQIRSLVLRLKQVLGKQFDVIYEGNHIHIEFDPKDTHVYLTKMAV